MLVVDSVRAGYVPGIDILNGISTTFEDEKITAVIGPNGAGKSTLLKTIFGFLAPSEGRIELDGADLTGYEPREMLSEVGLAYIPQERSVFPDLTVRDNLLLGGWTIRDDRERLDAALEDVYDEFPALNEKRDERAGTLSGGQQRMIEIGRSLITDPDVVLVDEPSVGLAPNLAMDVYDSITQLREAGVTVVLVDQNISAAIENSDRLVVLQNGRVAESGDSEEMQEDIESLVSEWISTEANV